MFGTDSAIRPVVMTVSKRVTRKSGGPRGWAECKESQYIILTHYGLDGRVSVLGEVMEIFFSPDVCTERLWGLT